MITIPVFDLDLSKPPYYFKEKREVDKREVDY